MTTKVKKRQTAILDYLQTVGQATVDELVEKFVTTGTTIRKDLIQLAQNGLIIRTYGGAILNKEVGDQPIDHKTYINISRKKKIAEEAAKLIHEGDSLIFDAGSTVAQMIPMLAKFNNLTIMTNSLQMINELVTIDSDQTLIISGGTFRRKSASFHSNNSISEAEFSQYSFDKLFMGADGVDITSGTVTTFNESCNGSVAMCKAAGKIILLVDSSKFGRRGPNTVCRIDAVHTIITDNGIDEKSACAIEAMGIKLIRVMVEDE